MLSIVNKERIFCTQLILKNAITNKSFSTSNGSYFLTLVFLLYTIDRDSFTMVYAPEILVYEIDQPDIFMVSQQPTLWVICFPKFIQVRPYFTRNYDQRKFMQKCPYISSRFYTVDLL